MSDSGPVPPVDGSIGHPSQALLSHAGREGCARRGGTLASSAADAVRGDVPKRQMAPSCDVQRGKIRVRTGSFSACCLPVKPNSCYPALPTPFVPETCWANPAFRAGKALLFVRGTLASSCAGHGLAGRFLFCASCGPTAVRHLKRRLQRRFGPCFQNRFILREKSFILRARFGVSANFFSKNISCKHNTLQLHPTVFSKKMKKICAGHIFSGQKSLPTGEGAVFLAHSVGTRRFFWGWMLPTATGQHTVFVDFFVFKIKRLGQ